MSEVKAHTRKSKSGKIVKVRGYSRKGSQKKDAKGKMGKEFESKMLQREELNKRIKEREAAADADFANLLAGGYFDTKHYPGLRKSKPQSKKASQLSPPANSRNRNKKKGLLKKVGEVLEKVEDKVAKFIRKQNRKRHKRMLT